MSLPCLATMLGGMGWEKLLLSGCSQTSFKGDVYAIQNWRTG